MMKRKLMSLALAMVLAASSALLLAGCNENTASTQDDPTKQEKDEVPSAKEAFDLLQKKIHEKDFTMVEVVTGKMTVDGVVEEEVSADENTTTVLRDGTHLYVTKPSDVNYDYFIDLDQMIKYVLFKADFDDRAEKLEEADANTHLVENYFSPFGGSQAATWSADLFDGYDKETNCYPANTEKLTALLIAATTGGNTDENITLNSCKGYISVDGSQAVLYMEYDMTRIDEKTYTLVTSLTRTFTFADTTVEIPENLPALSEEN